jgi:FemAB-related protein (PEP-CTERM system-associated)
MNAMSADAVFTIREIAIRGEDAVRVSAFVAAQAEAAPFHRPEWLRAVETGCGQKGFFLIAEDGDGRIGGVLPLTAVRSQLFGNALVSSGFAVGGGVLATGPAAERALVEAAIAKCRDLGLGTLELRGGELPQGWHHDTGTYLGFVRDLAKDDEAERLAIPRKQRAEVRKALGMGLEVETGDTPQLRAEHYAVYAESVRNLGTPVFPRALFTAVLDEFGADADILTVRHEGRAVASVLNLYANGTVMPYWGGGTQAARGLRANDLMYYALMLHARSKKGCTRFDFGRSKVGTGPAAFKKNWGFEGQPLAYAKYTADGAAPREINPLSPKYRMQIALWQKLPLPIANLIGPMLSRGLG